MGEEVVSSDELMEVEVGTEEETEKERRKKDGSSEMVRWEKFLPKMVLRVLLVEADDSTRQIIAALLRKCSYRVAAVPDGLTAWETLKGRPHNIDLILTEVELPSISGYALLTLVMEHDICKNIPVIMMSSHDSISMVLKCMLKGAADFLLKPIRRNELRNLWQHVWRKQTLTAGHTPQNSHKVEATSENNAASNHSSDCATSSQKSKDCSEKGSDTQSSCVTPYLEAERARMQNMQGLSQLKGRSVSKLSNAAREKYEECVKLNENPFMHEIRTGGRSNGLGPEGALCNEAYNPAALRLGEEHNCAKKMIQDVNVRPENDWEKANISDGHSDVIVEPSSGAIDLIGTFDNVPKYTYGRSSLNDATNKFEFPPPLELSLRRFYPNNSKNQGTDERHALNHSNASAFSRYNSKTLHPFFPTSMSNCTEFKEETSKSPELSSNPHSQIISGVSQQRQHGASLSGSREIRTTLVIGQSEKAEQAYQSPQIELIPVPGVRLENICDGYGHVFPPAYYTQSSLPQAWSPKLAGQREQPPFPTSTSIQSNPEIHDFEQNYRQSDETTNNSVDQNVLKQNNMESVEELRHGSPTAQSTSSSLCNGVTNHNNSRAYGSFCDRNNGNGISAEKVMAQESLNEGDFFVHDGIIGMNSHRSSQREAALTKFRLKRKDRCYEKKVRYQSRKRLAEQRPRVKGQFVRQVQNDTAMADANG